MNDAAPPSDSLDELFARARDRRPDTSRAEYAFETRLLARLHASRQADRAWAVVSWRMIPFFAVFTLGLVLWQTQMISAPQEAEQIASTENPEAVDLWNNFN